MAEETQKRQKSRRLWLGLLVVFCLAATAALVVLALHFLPLLNRQPVDAPSSYPVSTPDPIPTVQRVQNPKDFAALQEQYPDIVGWLQVPGTVIDYPIMRSGADVAENFYLNHAPDKKYRASGSLYIQTLNLADFSDPNTVIYGHNMRNGTMFADLNKFRRANFFEAHSQMLVYTPGHILTYEIYSAFVYDDRHILNSFNFDDPEEYASFLQQTLSPSSMTRQVRQGVNVTTTDRILTLSTCTTRKSERYLVEGVLRDDQPTY